MVKLLVKLCYVGVLVAALATVMIGADLEFTQVEDVSTVTGGDGCYGLYGHPCVQQNPMSCADYGTCTIGGCGSLDESMPRNVTKSVAGPDTANTRGQKDVAPDGGDYCTVLCHCDYCSFNPGTSVWRCVGQNQIFPIGSECHTFADWFDNQRIGGDRCDDDSGPIASFEQSSVLVACGYGSNVFSK